MVTGDHHGTNASISTALDSLLDFRTGRIHHAHHPNKDHVFFQLLLPIFLGNLVCSAHRNSQHTHPFFGLLVVCSQNTLDPMIVELFRMVIDPNLTANWYQAVHSSLGEDNMIEFANETTPVPNFLEFRRNFILAGWKGMGSSHAFPLRVEGHFSFTRESFLQVFLQEASPRRSHNESSLSGIANICKFTVSLFEHGIICQCTTCQ